MVSIVMRNEQISGSARVVLASDNTTPAVVFAGLPEDERGSGRHITATRCNAAGRVVLIETEDRVHDAGAGQPLLIADGLP